MSLYLGSLVRRYPLPKLQKSIKPKSWVPLLNCSFSNPAVHCRASVSHFLSLVYSYINHNDPGKKPLVQSREDVVAMVPSFFVDRGYLVKSVLVLAMLVKCTWTACMALLTGTVAYWIKAKVVTRPRTAIIL